MNRQEIIDTANDYNRVFKAWKHAYKFQHRDCGGKRLGELESQIELMYDNVGKALLAAVKIINRTSGD